MGNDKVLSSLHAECDWLLQYYDVRKEARTSEIEAIGKAKVVSTELTFPSCRLLLAASAAFENELFARP